MTNTGKAWEAQLEQLHNRYARDRRANVRRGHQEVRYLKNLGERVTAGRKSIRVFEGTYAGEGPPDFSGLVAGGRSVAFDAKDTTKDRFAFSMLPRHQARDLEAEHLLGGIAFIALRLQGEAFVLPWAELGPRFWNWFEASERAGKGTASLAREDWWRPFDVLGGGWLDVVDHAR